ncbi:MAG: hypothetical protein RIR62_279, partial [Pseudomonadota bacterium]
NIPACSAFRNARIPLTCQPQNHLHADRDTHFTDQGKPLVAPARPVAPFARDLVPPPGTASGFFRLQKDLRFAIPPIPTAWPVRLSVRTPGFQPGKRGSTPLRAASSPCISAPARAQRNGHRARLLRSRNKSHPRAVAAQENCVSLANLPSQVIFASPSPPHSKGVAVAGPPDPAGWRLAVFPPVLPVVSASGVDRPRTGGMA